MYVMSNRFPLLPQVNYHLHLIKLIELIVWRRQANGYDHVDDHVDDHHDDHHGRSVIFALSDDARKAVTKAHQLIIHLLLIFATPSPPLLPLKCLRPSSQIY